MTCTQTFDFASDGETRPELKVAGPTFQEDRALCWRSSDDYTVSVWALSGARDAVPTVAGAVDEVWALQP